jgi:hypothetical protein
MPHVFISYVREDASLVDQLADQLRTAGIGVWVDRTSIRLGQRWDVSIRQAIRSGEYFIACFSFNSIEKTRSGMNEELLLAIDELRLRPLNHIWFIPVLLSDCNVPEFNIGGGATLQNIQYISLHQNWKTGIENILNVILPDRLRNSPVTKMREREILNAIDRIDCESEMSSLSIAKVSTFGRDAIPFLIERIEKYDPSDGYSKLNAELYIDCLGEIGAQAIQAVPTIIEYAKRSGDSRYVFAALGKIGGPLSLSMLNDSLPQFKNTLRGCVILMGLAEIGDMSILPLLIDALEQWFVDGDVTPNLLTNFEGEYLSSLFPYRVVESLIIFGLGAVPALKGQLFSSNQRTQIRAACVLAILDEKNSSKYEAVMTAGLQSGSNSLVKESLFALRCFSTVSTVKCIQTILTISGDVDPALRILTIKVLRGNCIELPETLEAIQALKNDRHELVRYAAIGDPPKPVWDEIYYCFGYGY